MTTNTTKDDDDDVVDDERPVDSLPRPLWPQSDLQTALHEPPVDPGAPRARATVSAANGRASVPASSSSVSTSQPPRRRSTTHTRAKLGASFANFRRELDSLKSSLSHSDGDARRSLQRGSSSSSSSFLGSSRRLLRKGSSFFSRKINEDGVEDCVDNHTSHELHPTRDSARIRAPPGRSSSLPTDFPSLDYAREGDTDPYPFGCSSLRDTPPDASPDHDHTLRNWRRMLQIIHRLDPRYQILTFFNDLAVEGVDKFVAQGCMLSDAKPLSQFLRAFARCGCFSVWRPTSNDAIRKMVLGEGVGKGLEIKGKSAKRGKFSGYVPFLQITKNEDKAKVSSMAADARVRVFYPNKTLRDMAFKLLTDIARSMRTKVEAAKKIIRETDEREAGRIQEEIQISKRNLSCNNYVSVTQSTQFSRRDLTGDVDYQSYEEALEVIHRYEVADCAEAAPGSTEVLEAHSAKMMQEVDTSPSHPNLQNCNSQKPEQTLSKNMDVDVEGHGKQIKGFKDAKAEARAKRAARRKRSNKPSEAPRVLQHGDESARHFCDNSVGQRPGPKDCSAKEQEDNAKLGIYKIHDYTSAQGVHGIEMPEKVLWEGYVAQQDISREEGSEHDTGRDSMPEFQDMNMISMREWEGLAGGSKEKGSPAKNDCGPRPVLWFADSILRFDGNDSDKAEDRSGEGSHTSPDPLCPLHLLMAYEEIGKVVPVVSDFDCFLLGTRGVKYQEPLRAPDLAMMHSCIDHIEHILANPQKGRNWTQRWLDMKKMHQQERQKESKRNPEEATLTTERKNSRIAQKIPKFGYADPTSYSMMTGAVSALRVNGAVRHGKM